MDNQDSNDRASRIAALLVQTSQAHGKYEVESLGGKVDPDWPSWYASYLRENGLPELLEGTPGQQQVVNDLEENLRRADERFRAADRGDNWPPYYAQYLLEFASS